MPARLFTDEQESEIANQYLTPLHDGTWLGATELAHMWKTNHTTIYKVLRRQGVKTRDATAAHSNGKRCKPIKNIAPHGEYPPLCSCGCKIPVEWSRRRNRWESYVKGHRSSPPYKTFEWLYENYIKLNRSAPDMAAEFGVRSTTIYRYLGQFGIDRRDASQSKLGIFSAEKNPAWKGGVTPVRQQLYKSNEWKKLVKTVFERDNYLCDRCGKTKSKDLILHAHHIKPFSDYPDLRSELSNLITLCDKCHSWVHSLDNTSKLYLG